jgi:hypothetical protein
VWAVRAVTAESSEAPVAWVGPAEALTEPVETVVLAVPAEYSAEWVAWVAPDEVLERV